MSPISRHALMAKLHQWLQLRGFTLEPIRNILIWQTLATVLTVITGLIAWQTTPWIFWISTGLALGTWNFYELSKFIIRLIPDGWSKKLLWGQVFRLHGRLLFTALLVYAAFVWCAAPPIAVLTGLVIAMLPVVFIGFSSRTHKL